MTSLPGAGGGHTADSAFVLKFIDDAETMLVDYPYSPVAAAKARTALARLEQTIDGLRRERSSLEAAANRTAAEAADAKNAWECERLMLLRATAAEAERDALRTTSQIRYDDYMAARAEANSLRAEHDAAHARVAELEQALAPLVDGKRNVTNFDLARARAVLGGPE